MRAKHSRLFPHLPAAAAAAAHLLHLIQVYSKFGQSSPRFPLFLSHSPRFHITQQNKLLLYKKGLLVQSKNMADKREKGNIVSGSSPMDMGSPPVEDENGSPSIRTAETLLRLLPVALCVVALMIMLKDSQSNEYGSLSYSDLGPFRFLVHANGICAGYSLLSAVVTAVPRPSTLSRAWIFFLLDQVLTYVILAASSVATVVAFLAYEGDEEIMWAKACGSFGGFCKKATASIGITFVVMVCYVGLSLLSSYRLFSKYDAPVGYNHRGIEITAFQG